MRAKYIFILTVLLLFWECTTKQNSPREENNNSQVIMSSDITLIDELAPKNKQVIDTVVLKEFNYKTKINKYKIQQNIRFFYLLDSINISVFEESIDNGNYFIDYMRIDSLLCDTLCGSVYKIYKKNNLLNICCGGRDSAYFYQVSDILMLRGETSNALIDILYDIFYYDGSEVYYFDEKNNSISAISIDNKEIRMLFQMSSMLKPEHEFVEGYQLFDDTYILEFGDWAGGYSSLNYYLYSIKKNEVEDITYNFKEINNLERNVLYMHSNTDDSKLFIHTERVTTKNVYSCIVDKSALEMVNATIFKKILAPSTKNKYKLIGYDISNSKIQHIYFKTKISDQHFMFGYKPNSELEILFFNLYNNKALRNDDIAALSINELKLLANMIFAKHGYDFDDLGLKIYFNYYDFYFSQGVKTKEIWKKFNATDYKNLWIIIHTINKLNPAITDVCRE
ncbi:MAG: YARHG domain-containing protein [Bacteroidetes bacterium]|nr:YARHG domain-containing protein [Bacteroidota bacterium]MBT6835525.1 YARHG domain-containing protein [Bacteroidota bacterium]MBT7144874.1 YARHG domain-containing protein [Bacteroidota bacterium]MBT7492453.1 YARHG domain-containing protein [Bacteroidota bacterium]